MSDWKFADPPNTAVFVTADVLSGEAPVTLVVHEESDGAWQFLPAIVSGEPKIISLLSMLKLDPSVGELFDLPAGWCALRESQTSPWVRSKRGAE